MERGNISVTDIATLLGTEEQVTYRIVLTSKDGNWLVHSMVLEVLPQPSMGWAPSFIYDYGRAAFLGGTIPGGVAQS